MSKQRLALTAVLAGFGLGEPTTESTSSSSAKTTTVINASTGEVLRELTIDLSKGYHPTGNPEAPPQNQNSPNLQLQVRAISMSCDISPSG